MSTLQDLPLDDGAHQAPPVVTARSRSHLSAVPTPAEDLSVLDLPGLSGSGALALDDDNDFEGRLESEIVFDDILRRATPKLVRYAQRRLGNLHEAEEVAQEALLRTFQNREKLATEDDVMAWATFVTSRLVIDRVRVRARSISVAEVPEGRRVGRDVAEIAEARADARVALESLEALPARQASILWAREVEGLSYDEIGDRFGLTEPTVRSLLHRGRKALRKEYAVRGGTIPVGGVAILGPWLAPIRHLGKLRLAAGGLIGSALLGILGLGVFALHSPNSSEGSDFSSQHAIQVSTATGSPDGHLGHSTTNGIPSSGPTSLGVKVRHPVPPVISRSCTNVENHITGHVGCRETPSDTTQWWVNLPVLMPGQPNHVELNTEAVPGTSCQPVPANPVLTCGAPTSSYPVPTSSGTTVRSTSQNPSTLGAHS